MLGQWTGALMMWLGEMYWKPAEKRSKNMKKKRRKNKDGVRISRGNRI